MAAPAVAIRLPSAAPMMVPAVPKVDSRTAEVTAAKALAMTWIGLISSRAIRLLRLLRLLTHLPQSVGPAQTPPDCPLQLPEAAGLDRPGHLSLLSAGSSLC